METKYFCPNDFFTTLNKNMEQAVTTTTTKGIVIGLIVIIISIAIYFANIDINGPVKWLSNVVFVIGIIWAASAPKIR